MSNNILTCVVSLNAVFCLLKKCSLHQIVLWIWGNKINTTWPPPCGLGERKLGNISDRRDSELLNILKFHLLPEYKINLLKYATVQHQMRGPKVIVFNKQVIALLTLGLKVHMRRETHYYQEMCGASKGSVIFPGVTENSSKQDYCSEQDEQKAR